MHARRQVLMAQLQPRAASSPTKRKREASQVTPASALPPEFERLIAEFGQIEAITERFAARGAVPTLDAVVDGADLVRDMVLQMVGAVPELYRVERRSDGVVLLVRLFLPQQDVSDASLPVWRLQEIDVQRRRAVLRSALQTYWDTHRTTNLPAFALPPRPPPHASPPPPISLSRAPSTLSLLRKESSSSHPSQVDEAGNDTSVPEELRGISASLINRVRERQALRDGRHAHSGSHHEAVLTALPRLADTLRALFSAPGCKVSSMALTQLVTQLQTALKQQKESIAEQLLELTRVVPQWASIVAVAQETGLPIEFLRLDRNISFVNVRKQLTASTANHTAPMSIDMRKGKS